MKYRKKPVVIEAVKWTGENEAEIGDLSNDATYTFDYSVKPTVLTIDTLEGTHLANVGDFIIRGVKGELYPCKPDIFEMTYEAVDALKRTDNE